MPGTSFGVRSTTADVSSVNLSAIVDLAAGEHTVDVEARLPRRHADLGRLGIPRSPGPSCCSVTPRLAAVEPASVEDVANGLRASATCPASRPRSSPTWPPSSASRCSSRARPASARPSWRRRWRSTSAATLIRLQCYEGLDEAKALYEWNYRKQLLRIQAEREGEAWETVHGDIFGEEFLLARPLMTAIASEEPVVLLIDEIDKTDQEFEAMLLELLSDFQISIPELGRIEARTQPVVLLTSNNSRELTEALKRRCLYLWLDYPEAEHELEIVRLHAPEIREDIARGWSRSSAMVRELDLKKPPSLAESIDWARALVLLGADDISPEVFKETMSIIVKHRTDLDIVAERVGVKLGLARRRELRRPAARVRRRPAARGHGAGDERAARRLRRAARGRLDRARPLPRGAGRDAAKSPEDRRIFDLVFERFFFRAAEAEAVRARRPRGRRRRRRRRARSEELSLDALREAVEQAIREGNESALRDLARLAIAAFGQRGQGSGVLGVDVQRIRRALGLKSDPRRRRPTRRRRRR